MADDLIYRNLYPPNWEGVQRFGIDVEKYQMEHRLMSLATALQLVDDWNESLEYLRRAYPALHALSNYPDTNPNLVRWRYERDTLVPAYLDRIAEYIRSFEPS
eukprot:2437744-Rhodomonas_salina.1